MGAGTDGEIAFQGFYGYLLPQFEGIDQATGEARYSEMKAVVGVDRAEQLRITLNAVLGLQLAKPVSGAVDDDEGQTDPIHTDDNSTP
jgi:hypothetical protein